jgi:hypothetical protein
VVATILRGLLATHIPAYRKVRGETTAAETWLATMMHSRGLLDLYIASCFDKLLTQYSLIVCLSRSAIEKTTFRSADKYHFVLRNMFRITVHI